MILYILFSLTLIKYQKWDRTEYFLLHKSRTSFGERMEMKSSYIWRTFSSTTLLLVSFFSSSHASQNIMFSSLNSVRRNCLKQPRPAALFITFSNDDDQERASSSVGRRLQRNKSNKSELLHSFSTSQIDSASCWDLSLPFLTVHGSLWSVFTSGPLDSLILAPNSQTEGKNAPDALNNSFYHIEKCSYNFENICAANTLSCHDPHRN